ncbi:hypothetical protein L0244_35965 [bacterium]|nr:hypothetical protein [bacterium]
MELSEMLAIKPSDYLTNGFYDDKGEFRENLNGWYSLAMAYRCREEGLDPENVDGIVNRLEGIAEKHVDTAVEHPEQAVDSKSIEQLKKLGNDQNSTALNELLDAAQSRISNWKDYSALVVHMERITAQLALLNNLPQGNITES